MYEFVYTLKLLSSQFYAIITNQRLFNWTSRTWWTTDTLATFLTFRGEVASVQIIYAVDGLHNSTLDVKSLFSNIQEVKFEVFTLKSTFHYLLFIRMASCEYYFKNRSYFVTSSNKCLQYTNILDSLKDRKFRLIYLIKTYKINFTVRNVSVRCSFDSTVIHEKKMRK